VKKFYLFFQILVLTAGAIHATAASCDPTTSPDACRPTALTASISLTPRGVQLTWALYDDPLPDKVQVVRSPAFPQATGNPAVLPGDVSGFLDASAAPGQLYNYTVCTLYQVTYCSNTVSQGLPGGGNPPPPTTQPIAPSNLEVRDTSGWVSQTHWQEKFSLTWVPGKGFSYLTLFTGHMWDKIENISPTSSNLEITDPSLLHLNVIYQFRICGIANPQPLSNCSNTVTIYAPRLPLAKPPIKVSALAQSQHEVLVAWSSGDDNVSAWFDVQRQDVDKTITGFGTASVATRWTTLEPRIAFGARGFLVDKVQTDVRHAPVMPLTYRVCAGNASGKTCSEPIHATGSRVAPAVPH